MKKLIVTGASGILGRRIMEILSDSEFEVYALYKTNDSVIKSSKNIKKIPCNIFDEKAISDLLKHISATHLIHLAWTTEHGKYAESVSNFDWLKSSINLLKHFAENGGKKFVGAETFMEYSSQNSGLLNEDSTLNFPNTFYGKNKVNFKNIAKDYCEKMNIDFCWGKIFFLFGEGEDKNKFISSVINSSLQGKEISCRNPNVLRDYISSSAAAQIFINLLKRDIKGEFNVSCGNVYSLRQLVYLILNLLNIDDKLFNDSIDNLDKNQIDLIAADLTKLKKYNLLEDVSENFEDEIKKIIKSISNR